MAYKLHYSDYPGTDTGPPDPERWVGPPGPMGPPGPQGPQGQPQTGGPFLPIAGGTLTGPLTTQALTVNGTVSGTSIGTGIGQVPLFVNYQSSGKPGLFFPPRLIIDRSGASSANDFATIQINRTVTHTGGAGGAVVAAVRAITQVNATATNQEWAVIGQASSASTVGAVAVGGDFQGIRSSGGNAAIWGGIFDAIDQTLVASSVGQQAVIGGEIDVEATGADDANNAATFGAKGVRKGIQVVIVRQGKTIPLEVSNGLWFSVNEPTQAKYSSVIGTAIGTQTYSFLDARGAVAPTGYTDPVAGVRMSAGQAIDFNGGTALNSNAGNYLQYTTTGGNRLRYMVGAVERFTLPDTKPTVTGAKGSNAALASLLTALVAANLITDSTTA